MGNIVSRRFVEDTENELYTHEKKRVEAEDKANLSCHDNYSRMSSTSIGHLAVRGNGKINEHIELTAIFRIVWKQQRDKTQKKKRIIFGVLS